MTRARCTRRCCRLPATRSSPQRTEKRRSSGPRKSTSISSCSISRFPRSTASPSSARCGAVPPPRTSPSSRSRRPSVRMRIRRYGQRAATLLSTSRAFRTTWRPGSGPSFSEVGRRASRTAEPEMWPWAIPRACSTPGVGNTSMTAKPLRELPARFSLPLIGDTLAFVRDPAGFLQERARELGPVFRIDVFGAPTACFVGPEAFALVLDDKNVARAGANPPHVEELFNPEAVPFLDGEKQRRRKRLLMRAFTADALEEYLPTIEEVIDRYANRWAGLGRFKWVPE